MKFFARYRFFTEKLVFFYVSPERLFFFYRNRDFHYDGTWPKALINQSIRADWDEFFKDNKDMNELKAGERPDTLVLNNLPCKWFLQMQVQCTL